jgi:transcription antitermination factor NusG
METKAEKSNWHVVYTMPKSERKVASAIAELGMEPYLPLHNVVRQWSDRKKKLLVPLFPNYVFVKVNPEKRGYLYSIRELVRFVSIEKKPVVVREKEITTLKQVLSGDLDVANEVYFQQGMKVRVMVGQFSGLEGIVTKVNGNTRLTVKIDGLMRAFSFNVSAHHTEVVPST